jgi:Tfp pilus assembly protein PilX
MNYTRQKAFTLILVLLFLAMLSYLGASIAQWSTSEERMASNAQRHQQALQAAEAVLSYLENNLATGANFRQKRFDGSQPGLRDYDICRPNALAYWNGNGAADCHGIIQVFDWTNRNSAMIPEPLPLSSDHDLNRRLQPRYVIERLTPSGSIPEYYRVTARGSAGNVDAVVILQTQLSYSP